MSKKEEDDKVQEYKDKIAQFIKEYEEIESFEVPEKERIQKMIDLSLKS